MLEEDVHHQLEVVVQHPHHFLGRQLLGEASEAADVAEEDGQLAERAALGQLDAPTRRLLDQRGREEARELRALRRLELQGARVFAVLQRHGSLRGDGGEDLQVLGGEGGDALAGIEEHDPLHLLAGRGEQGNGHRAAHTERDDRLRGLEPFVGDGVGGEHSFLGELDLGQQRIRDQHLALARLALPHGLDDQLLRVRIAQEDDAVVTGDEIEGDLQDAPEQLVEVALEAHVGGELVSDAQPLVVALELAHVLDLLDGKEGRLGRSARDDSLELAGLSRVHDLCVFRSRGAAGEAELHLRSPDQHLVTVGELRRSEDALSVEEGAVRGTQVAQDVIVPLAVDLAVLAGDLAIRQPHRCGGAAAEHAALSQRIFGDFAAGPFEDQPRSGRGVRR